MRNYFVSTILCNQQHVGRRTIKFKVVGDILFQDRRRERPESFPILDLKIQFFLHLRVPCVPQDAAITQSTRAEFHSPLKPANDISILKFRRGVRSQAVEVLIVACLGAVSFHCVANLFVRELRPKVGTLSSIPGTINFPLISSVDMPDSIRCPNRSPCVTGGRLNPEILKNPRSEDLPVGHTVERYTSSHNEIL